MRVFALALVLLMTSYGFARAEASDDEPDCVASKAQLVTVRTVAENQVAWRGRCVKIRGVAVRRWLFDDLPDADHEIDGVDPSMDGRTLGFNRDGALSRRLRTGPRRVTLIGRVNDCRETRAEVHALDGPEGIVFVGGYCHSYDGAYIAVASARDHGRPR